MVDVHLGLGEAPRALVLLLAGFSRQTFALQHLQQFLDGLVPSVERLLLRVDAQLHLLQSLPQEEQLFGLPFVLAVQTVEVLLGELGGEGLPRPRPAAVLLEQLVEVALDAQLVLESLDGHLEVLRETKNVYQYIFVKVQRDLKLLNSAQHSQL